MTEVKGISHIILQPKRPLRMEKAAQSRQLSTMAARSGDTARRASGVLIAAQSNNVIIIIILSIITTLKMRLGMKGSRIHGIVRELKNENIDVINYTSNIQLLIQRSLTPAKISYMNIDNEKKQADVYLKADQVSLAIGRRGVNIKLACELTGFELDVFREDEEKTDEFDIDLDEFSDEIETWVIDEFKRVGCDTARSVLNLTAEDLERRTDLEKETIDDVRKILQAEFDKE